MKKCPSDFRHGWTEILAWKTEEEWGAEEMEGKGDEKKDREDGEGRNIYRREDE